MLFRTVRILLLVLFIVTAVVFTVFTVYQYTHEDIQPPVFTMDQNVIEVSVNASNEELCAGLHAYDNMDGDISSRISVYKVSQLISLNEATITYVVFDDAGNSALASRTIRYTDYRRPHFSISEPLIFRIGDTIRLDAVTASDVLDGNITNRITYDASISTVSPGFYPMLMQVVNSAGDASTLTVTLIVEDGSASMPSIRLNEYLIYVGVGETLDYPSFVKSVRDPRTPDRIPVSKVDYNADNVDLSTPGTYEVYYFYTGISGDTATVILTVVVE